MENLLYPCTWYLLFLFLEKHKADVTLQELTNQSSSVTMPTSIPSISFSSSSTPLPPLPFISGSVQEKIVRLLNISPGLLDRHRNDLRLSYRKYEAINNTQVQINKLVADGTWKHSACIPHNFHDVELILYTRLQQRKISLKFSYQSLHTTRITSVIFVLHKIFLILLLG
jgi:hypothetical protein